MASRPAFGDLIALGRAIKRGSTIEAPMSLAGAIREVVSPETARDSPLTLTKVIRHPEYRDLSTAKVAAGDQAPDFALPRYDFSDGTAVETDETVTLSGYRDAQPVALIFGSYT